MKSLRLSFKKTALSLIDLILDIVNGLRLKLSLTTVDLPDSVLQKIENQYPFDIVVPLEYVDDIKNVPINLSHSYIGCVVGLKREDEDLTKLVKVYFFNMADLTSGAYKWYKREDLITIDSPMQQLQNGFFKLLDNVNKLNNSLGNEELPPIKKKTDNNGGDGGDPTLH